ncbi:MAG: type II CAAX endopeptidase family protein [Methylococcales bacterium]|nr:type II CAAX endopeptidase family protein [Methylococcales bacterium]
MDKSLFKFDEFFKSACYFEASLVLVAVFLGWVANIDPFKNIYFSETAIALGVIGTAPLFLMFLAMEQMQGKSVTDIRKLLLNTLGPGLHRYHWTDLFILAAIAGVSEELLFRGVIQPWIEASWGMMAGLIVSNIAFGLVHAVTPLYAVLAALVGVYLGLSLDYGGDRNLLIPIIIHGFYDFLAFVALMRVYRAGLASASKD